MEADRWYVLGREDIAQPRRGFRSARAAWEWLRWGEFDLRGLSVVLGGDALRDAAAVVVVPVEGEGDDRQHQDQEQERVDCQPAEDGEDEQKKGKR